MNYAKNNCFKTYSLKFYFCLIHISYISKYIKKKIHALKFYKSELRKFPHSRSIKNIKSLAQIRGTSCGVNYAEGFVMSRYIE